MLSLVAVGTASCLFVLMFVTFGVCCFWCFDDLFAVCV